MNIELKKLIINYIIDNINEFQLCNSSITKFRPYIFDEEGDCLIGGDDVYEFIVASIELLTTK